MATMALADNVGNGTASCETRGSRTASSSGIETTYVTYWFEAIADGGWRFVRWERRSRTRSRYPGYDWENWSNWGGWFTAPLEKRVGTMEVETAGSFPQGVWGRDWEYEYEVRAVFEQRANTGTLLCTGAGAMLCGASGSLLYVG